MLHFGWFVGHGFGVQGWGTPGYGIGYDWKKPAPYQHAVREFERAGLDLFIIEDSLTVPDTYGGSAEVSLAQASFAPKHDPLALVPYLLSATEHLGIVPTISASFYPPFTAARLLATLQHFSNGQLGWNVVTSGSDLAAQNYGLDQQIEHDLRYEKAEEFVDVVRKLWRSWEPDAILEDARAGVFADHTKVRPIHHDGEFFKVRGPLNTAPLPEEPVLVQAGASPRGKAFAGANADVAIALARGVDGMKAYRDSIRAEAAGAGRNPDDVKVLFVLKPTVTGSRAEAEELRAARRELTQRDIDSQLNSISYLSRHRLQAVRPRRAPPRAQHQQQSGHAGAFLQGRAAGFHPAADPAGPQRRRRRQHHRHRRGNRRLPRGDRGRSGRRRVPLLRLRRSGHHSRRAGQAGAGAPEAGTAANELRRRRLPPESAGLLAPWQGLVQGQEPGDTTDRCRGSGTARS
ncbi:NtaA/DmoA family FMN-dependent monooxygenase [Arthrobacter globiformis]|uniref:NtaA/DmoA family FMN-dependent monooxygenase n=1 Tax=Arthrobacter globiformis TaxID=1665 RepID=UPI0027D7DCB2|nr:NtaA/DmoA family FMN-dependent monooxygenase [Arthrobacter globiformis]